MQFSFSDLLRIGVEQYEMFIEENYIHQDQERNIVLMRQLSDFMLLSPSAISHGIVDGKNNYIAGFTRETVTKSLVEFAKTKRYQYMVYNFANKEVIISRVTSRKSKISNLFHQIHQTEDSQLKDPFSAEFRPFIHRLYYETDPIVYVSIEDPNSNSDILLQLSKHFNYNNSVVYLRIARMLINSIFKSDVNFYSTDAKVIFGKISAERFFHFTGIQMLTDQDVIVEVNNDHLQLTFFINCSLKKKYFDIYNLTPELQQIYNYLYY
jgi:hypothetical protein